MSKYHPLTKRQSPFLGWSLVIGDRWRAEMWWFQQIHSYKIITKSHRKRFCSLVCNNFQEDDTLPQSITRNWVSVEVPCGLYSIRTYRTYIYLYTKLFNFRVLLKILFDLVNGRTTKKKKKKSETHWASHCSQTQLLRAHKNPTYTSTPTQSSGKTLKIVTGHNS